MPARLIDWIARTVMLVLAGLVTLSILGAIAAIPSEPGTNGFFFQQGRERSTPRAPDAAPAAPQPEPVAPSDNETRIATEPGPTGGIADEASAPMAPAERQAQWLEAIAYALLALAGLLALGLVVLALAMRQLRRIADALESSNA